jgi:hypothetical protein
MAGLTTITQPPDPDEVEVSLFGPGFGECVVVHLGNNLWMVVDCCLELSSKRPAPIYYLQQLGREIGQAVCLVVATHWHDDHIEGISEVIEKCPSAKYAVTSALGNYDFISAIAPWVADAGVVDDLGCKELKKLSTIRKSGRRPALASENKELISRTGSVPCRVMALSPSDPAVLATVARLSSIPRSIFRTRMPSIKGNDASVVLSVEVGERRILLGADLQTRQDRDFGWLAIVDSHEASNHSKYEVFKVPHHSSENGDDPSIWSTLLNHRPPVMMTPCVTGSTKLPTSADRDRILRATDRAYLTVLDTFAYAARL